MKVIYKQPLTDTVIRMSVTAAFKPLAVHIQRGLPCLWFETDDSLQEVNVAVVYLVGTGTSDLRLVPPDAAYIGTFMSPGEDIVLHTYVAIRPKEGHDVRSIQM